MNSQHFILTRFNIATPGREVAIRNAPGWLERRFELFERYCLSSMAAQDMADFTWLIYFDRDTPDQFRERIARAQAVAPFEARFVGLTQMADVAADVRQRLAEDCAQVITTRLDNDDAVACNFVAAIQQAAQRNVEQGADAGAVLNFPHGIALRRGRLYSANDASNPFTSLVEGAHRLKTIWSVPHHLLHEAYNIRQITSGPIWLQIVHGDNVTNRIKGVRLADSAVLADFVIRPDPELVETGTVTLALDRFVYFPMRQLREVAISLAKPIRTALRRRGGRL